MKAELSAARAETVVLHRTEAILRARDKNLDELLSTLEAKAGVTGYRETEKKLEQASKRTAEVDKQKEQTLDDISAMVKEIASTLKEKQHERL